MPCYRKDPTTADIVALWFFPLLFFISCFILPINSQASELKSQTTLRTLFTTSHERNKLDQLRDQGHYDKQQTTDNSLAIIRPPIVVKMQGVVMRKDQKPVVFVNDGNTIKSQTVNDEIIVQTKRIKRDSYKVPVRVNQKTIKLQPGQQWDEKNRTVEDNYQIKPPIPETSVSDTVIEPVDNITNKVQ